VLGELDLAGDAGKKGAVLSEMDLAGEVCGLGWRRAGSWPVRCLGEQDAGRGEGGDPRRRRSWARGAMRLGSCAAWMRRSWPARSAG
jgi:hypothetical protein